MSTADFIKMALIGVVFLMAAPLGGMAIKDKPAARRWVFGLMCFMTINGLFGPGNWGLTVDSIETYRGHTKGFHFYLNQALAVALIVARFAESPGKARLMPPGFGWYLLYCAASFLSIVNAPRPDYAVMALHKMLMFGLLGVATYNTLRTEDDLQFFLRTMAGTMMWQFFICMKMKYLEGQYQVHGTFEHQNPLAMYGVLIGTVMLAAALGPKFPGADMVLIGFVAAAGVVQSTLSRGALAAFAAGVIGVIGFSLLEKPTARRLTATGIMGAVGTLGLLLTLDTIIARFGDHGNEASSELRHVMNAASKRMLQDHHLGIGWNNFALAFNPPFPYVEELHEWVLGRGMKIQEDAASPVVESHYWLLLAETGYQGFTTYMLVILMGLWRNFRALLTFRHGFVRSLSFGIAVACTLNYVQSTLERVLVQPRNLGLWIILLGVTARIESLRREAVLQKRLSPIATSPSP